MTVTELLELVRLAMSDVSNENVIGKGCGSSFRGYNDIILQGFTCSLYMFLFEEFKPTRNDFKYIALNDAERIEIRRILTQHQKKNDEIDVVDLDDLDDDSLAYCLNCCDGDVMLKQDWISCKQSFPQRLLTVTKLVLRYCCDDFDVFYRPEY